MDFRLAASGAVLSLLILVVVAAEGKFGVGVWFVGSWSGVVGWAVVLDNLGPFSSIDSGVNHDSDIRVSHLWERK